MQTQAQGWNDIYKSPEEYKYYDVFKAHSDMEMVCEIFSKHNCSKVLDLGCGVGRNMIYMLDKGFAVTGIDMAESGIDELNKILRLRNSSAKVDLGKFEQLPYRDGEFNGVISVQTLNHGYTKDIEKGFSELARVVKNNGLVFITVSGRYSQGKVRFCLVKTATQVEKRVYIPTKGSEIGVPHFIFTKKELFNLLLPNFKILKYWVDDKDYYCVIAQRLSSK